MLYSLPKNKQEVPATWTKYLLVTHPVVFISTVGIVRKKVIPGVAPFATCLDTSYNPPYVTFSVACQQHSVVNGDQNTGRMNTYLNLKQNGLLVVNVPGQDLLAQLDVIAYPYSRVNYKDKLALAGLTKARPFYLYGHPIYPPLIQECLAHLEGEVVDIHRPCGSDHHNVTARIIGASYDCSLGDELDEIRWNLVRRTWHHFGSNSNDYSERYIAVSRGKVRKNSIIFHLEKRR